jgi:regulatory protein YycI of two-component signal transduction system YycFG
VFTKINKYDPDKGQITTWAFRIAKNECLSHIKKGKRKTSLEKYCENGFEPTSANGFSVGAEYNMEDMKTEQDFLDEYNETQLKYNLAINGISDLSPLYRDIIHDRIINGMDYKSIMYKHDAQFVKYEQQYKAGKVSERFYNKEYKRALQRVKNRIKRGREMLGAMVNEKYQEECI